MCSVSICKNLVYPSSISGPPILVVTNKKHSTSSRQSFESTFQEERKVTLTLREDGTRRGLDTGRDRSGPSSRVAHTGQGKDGVAERPVESETPPLTFSFLVDVVDMLGPRQVNGVADGEGEDPRHVAGGGDRRRQVVAPQPDV